MQAWGVDPFTERYRDTHEFKRRQGALPVQQASDGSTDYRGLLHRDGTVISAVTLADLAQPEELYRKLGCKLAVGMPFKVGQAIKCLWDLLVLTNWLGVGLIDCFGLLSWVVVGGLAGLLAGWLAGWLAGLYVCRWGSGAGCVGQLTR